jgi:hypothetical protein
MLKARGRETKALTLEGRSKVGMPRIKLLLPKYNSREVGVVLWQK